MIDLATIFSSKAKIKTLRILYYQPKPIPLRHIAYLSGLPVYSIQRALKQLLENKIIKKAKKGRNQLFSIIKDSPSYKFLSQTFKLETNIRLNQRSSVYQQKAKSALDFADSAYMFFKDLKVK